MKNIRIFYLKKCHFLVVKFIIYLNRCVFIMSFKGYVISENTCERDNFLSTKRAISPTKKLFLAETILCLVLWVKFSSDDILKCFFLFFLRNRI